MKAKAYGVVHSVLTASHSSTPLEKCDLNVLFPPREWNMISGLLVSRENAQEDLLLVNALPYAT